MTGLYVPLSIVVFIMSGPSFNPIIRSTWMNISALSIVYIQISCMHNSFWGKNGWISNQNCKLWKSFKSSRDKCISHFILIIWMKRCQKKTVKSSLMLKLHRLEQGRNQYASFSVRQTALGVGPGAAAGHSCGLVFYFTA